jgi:AraC-like DNA-binding protein
MILPETARTLRTSDIGRATEHISRVFASHRLDVAAGARRLAVEHRQSGWPDASFNELCYGGQVLIEAPALLDFYMLQFTLRGCCEITQRRRSLCLPAGTAAVINPDCRYTKRWSADAVQVIVRVSRTRLSRLLAGLLGREGPAAVGFAFAACEMHAQASYLWEIVKCLGPRAASDAVSRRETVHTAAVDHLLTVLLHTMPNSQQEALVRDDIEPARPRFVRLAQDYIDANATERVTLVELSAVAGVAARTLHRGFQRHLGVTPFQYLRSARLTRARQQLRNSASTRVADVAMNCGYVNLGRFARDYAALHGERPSQTRRRARA